MDTITTKFRIFDSLEEDLGSEVCKVLRSRGCNGFDHVDEVDEIFTAADGEVEYARSLFYHKRGSCDGTCSGADTKGGFLLWPTKEVPLLESDDPRANLALPPAG